MGQVIQLFRIKLIEVISDDYEGLATPEAYKELVLQMSTGGFHTHKHKGVYADDYYGVLELVDGQLVRYEA